MKYTYRFTTTAEVVVTVDTEYGPDRLDAMDEDEREEWAYEDATKRGKERTHEVSVSSHGVAIHLDIDGIEGERVED